MPHLLAAVDLSDVTKAVIAEAELIAQALGAKLTLLYVADPNADDVIGFGTRTASRVTSRLDDQRDHLEKLAAELRYRGIHTDAVFIEGPTAKTILQQADERDVSMIVLGSHGHGALYHALVGGTSGAVIKASRRPVLVVPDPRPERHDND
jgi:nucleotide-binding universal stress UspA family protein